MNRKSCFITFLALFALFAITASTTGCSRDPNVRKQKYLESGKRYFEKGRYREAAIQFSNALRIDSKFGEAHYRLGLCDLRLGSAQNAYVELSRAVTVQPDNLPAELDLGELLLLGGRHDEAFQRAEYVLSKDPNNLQAHILKANADAGMKQMDQALAEMNTAVELDPKRSDSYLTLGVLEAAKTPNSPAVEADFKKAAELDAKAIRPRLALAALYDQNKRFVEAEQQLQQALGLAPRDQQVRTAYIRHYLLQGDKDLAKKAAQDAKTALATDPNGAQFLAKYYLSVSDTKAATDEYQQLAKQFPKERQIQHAYLELLMVQNQNDAALQQVQAILKHFSKDNEALTDRGVLLLAKGKTAEARDLLYSVLKANPQNVEALFTLGNCLKALGDPGQAETQWREAAKVQPGYLPAQRALGEVAIEKHDASSLAEIAKTVIEKAPKAVDGYLMQAQADIFNNDPAGAETALEKAIEVTPTAPLPYVQLGRLRMILKRDAEAEKVLDQALQLDAQNTDALAALVQVYVNEKQPAKAMQRARDMTARFEGNARAHLVFGQLAASQNELDLAEKEFQRATQLEPGNSAAYYQLAALQIDRHELPQAQSTFQTIIQKNPRDQNAYWMLGTVFEQEQDTKRAETYYRKALELEPDLAAAANNLAYLMLQNGENIDQVITYAEVARRQMPNSPAVADTLGWAYYRKGTSRLAIELLKDAVNGNAKSATYHYHLGKAYQSIGDRPKAKSELQKAIQLESEQSKKEDIRKDLASLS